MRARVLVAGAVCAALLAGCSGGGKVEEKKSVLVLAATSTRDALEEMAKDFQKETGVEVKVSAGASNALAAQIESGAPADLFLSASAEWAAHVADRGHAAERRDLLGNTLVLVVPKGNPAGVETPADLAAGKAERVALAGENVPAGKYARQALKKAGVLGKLEQGKRVVTGKDVRATLAYVEQGEAEAGIVYATDARISDQVEVVYTFPAGSHDRIVYPLVLLREPANRDGARRFYDYLLAPGRKAAFEKHGFTRPGE
jgi:molybdate transport system substrate-binding protein